MKKILFTILLNLMLLSINAQLKITDPTTTNDVLSSYTVQIVPGSPTHSLDFEIHNNYSVSKTIKIKRYILQHTSGHDIYYCFGTNCYTANSNPVFIPTQDVTLIAGGSLPNGGGTYGLKTDFDDNNVTGSSLVRYTLYDINNFSDSVSFTIKYEVGTVGIKQHDALKYSLNMCMPNPAKSFTIIPYELKNYDGNAKIILFDIIGNKVKEFKLENNTGNLKIDLTNLSEGIYFYSLQINQKNLVSRKLIVE